MRKTLATLLILASVGCHKNVSTSKNLVEDTNFRNGIALIKSNDFVKANKSFEKSVQQNPNDYDLRNLYSYSLLRSKNFKKLRDNNRSLKRQFPEKSAGWYYSHLSKVAQNKSKNFSRTMEALDEINGAIKRSEGNGNYRLLRAETNLKLFREKAAAQDLKDFMDSDHRDHFSDIKLKEIFCSENFTKKYISEFKMVQNWYSGVSNRSVNSLHSEACLSEVMGNYLDAEKLYENALRKASIEKSNNTHNIAYSLAKVYIKNGKYHKAKKIMRKLVISGTAKVGKNLMAEVTVNLFKIDRKMNPSRFNLAILNK